MPQDAWGTRYSLELRARATRDRTILEKHDAFLACLRRANDPWGIDDRNVPNLPENIVDLVTSIPLTGVLGAGIRGLVAYSFRGDRYLRDAGVCDDFLDLTFRPRDVPYAELVNQVIVNYITAFDAYRAEVGPDRFVAADVEEQGHRDLRSHVYRIHPICFFDSVLCKRAFRLSPEKIKDRLVASGGSARLVNDGVLIIASDAPLSVAESEDINHRYRHVLGLK